MNVAAWSCNGSSLHLGGFIMNRYVALFLMARAAGQAMAQTAEVSQEREAVFISTSQRAAVSA
jgi:hypothetical protein